MKKLLSLFFFLILFLVSIRGYGQRLEFVKLSKNNIYINSQTNVLGSARAYISIKLPYNTVSWSYSFITTTNQDVPLFNLARYAMKHYTQGTSEIVLKSSEAIMAFTGVGLPEGKEPCNIYLLDGNNINSFLNWKRFTYYNSGTKFNYRQGIFFNTWPTQGLYYLGLENPGILNGIYVNIEVIAIVKKY